MINQRHAFHLSSILYSSCPKNRIPTLKRNHTLSFYVAICSHVDDVLTAVIVENFDKTVIAFAKRNHIYKDANFEDPFAEKKQKKAVAVGDGTKIRVSDMEETDDEPSPTSNFASAILAGGTAVFPKSI